MKIKTDTIAQARARREAWKRKFALFPVKVADGRWCWLEMVEVREVSTCRNFVWLTTVQHRAIGSTEFFPPYPFRKGECANGTLEVPVSSNPFIERQFRDRRSHPEVTFKTPGERD